MSSGPGNTAVIWDLPHERNADFVGRGDLLAEVRQRLAGGDRVQVLHGLGGVGKTQAAVEFAHRYAGDYSLVWWVPAGGESTVLAAYERLAHRLGERLSPKSSPAVAVDVLNGLLGGLLDGRRWLLVFDGAGDPAALRPLLPATAGGGGHVLITSRNGHWGHVAHARPVRVLARAESVELLARRTGGAKDDGPGDGGDAARLALTLGDLPLALEQAAAVIRQDGLSYGDYLRRFETQWASLLGQGLRPVDYPRSVAMTWGIAFAAVEAAAPAAGDLLKLATFLDADHVPLSLLRDGAAALPPALVAVATDARLWDAAVAALLGASLVEVAPGDGTGESVADRRAFGVHRLVAAVTRDRMDVAAQGTWCGVAVGLLAEQFQFDSGNVATWPACGHLLPHVLAATAHAERLSVAASQTTHLLNDAGRYLLKVARPAEARPLLERALALCGRAVDPADPKLSGIANNLGRAHDRLGQVDLALHYYGRAIEIDTAFYGQTHPHVAEVVNNYGVCLQKRGDRRTASEQFAWAARVYESHYGPHHPKLAQMLNNLGYALKSLDDPAGARAQLDRALDIAEATVGPDHPTTARILFNLADVMRSAGEPVAAHGALERALAVDEAAHGPDHPDVRADCVALAAVLDDLDEPGRAAAYRDRAGA